MKSLFRFFVMLALSQAALFGQQVTFDAAALSLTHGANLTSWGGQTAGSTPTFLTNQTPNGGPAVEFNGSDRMGDNVLVAPSSKDKDWIYVAVIKPQNTGSYHNLVDDDPGLRPMLWIDDQNRYELNAGGTIKPTAGQGPGGWDIVIADSRLNQLYVNTGTAPVAGGLAVNFSTIKQFDFFHRDGTASFQGLVAEARLYRSRDDFGGSIAALYDSLVTKWITASQPPEISDVSPSSGSLLGGTVVTITGSGFSGVSSVTFGGTSAASFTVLSATQISATTPAHAAGTVSVQVTTPPGTNTANTLFTYVVPPNQPPSFTLPEGAGTPAGAAWTARLGVSYWKLITSSADGSRLAAVDDKYVYASADGGQNWMENAQEDRSSWRSMATSSDGLQLVVADYGSGIAMDGTIQTSNDGGVTWAVQPAAGNRMWTGVCSSADGSKLAAVAENGQIFTSTNGGLSWAARETSRNWSAITCSSDGSKLAATVLSGQIYTSTDGGVTWTARAGAGSRAWWSITSSADGMKLAATVEGGQIFTSTDSGVSWTARESPRAWRSIVSSADGTKLAVLVEQGQVYTSTDSGVSWTARDSARPWRSLASSADGSKLAAAVYEGQIYTSTAIPAPHEVAVAAGSGAFLSVGFATSISPGPSNESTQAVSFQLGNSNTALFTVQPALSGDGTLTFTPGTTQGTATITVNAVDDGGTANGGVNTSAAQAFLIRVIPPGSAISTVTTQSVSSELAAGLNRGGVRAVDGSGLTGGQHTHLADGTMWLTHGTFQAPHDPLPAEIIFDLGASHHITWMRVWNYNEAGAIGRGAKDVSVSVASSPGGPFVPAGSLVLPIATGLPDYAGAEVGFTASNVRLVRFEITSNHGGDQSFAGLSEITFYGLPATAPTVTGVTPASGPTIGGTTVTITGTNFTGATRVTFDEVLATSFTVDSPTQITAVTPWVGNVGGAQVQVATNNGISIQMTLFTYLYTIDSWRLEHFGNATGTGNLADTADFDSDSVSNLLEYAYGTNPTVSSSAELTMSGTYAAATFGSAGKPVNKLEPSTYGVDFRYLFTRREDYVTSDLTYIPEFSSDLSTWHASGSIPTVLATSGGVQLVSVPYPHYLPTGKKARFARLRITITP